MGNDYKDGADEEETEVFLDHDVTFSVPTEDIAKEYVKMDEAHTSIAADPESGEWNVTRHAGSMIRVPRRATMTRTVGGQFPKGFDPLKWGIPASMVGDVDKIALWNIVTTVDAYLSAGFTPTEVLQAIHPSMVASTQGTGFGGMMSMRKLYLDRFLNHEIPTDILQEPAERGGRACDAVLRRRLRQHDPAGLRLRHRRGVAGGGRRQDRPRQGRLRGHRRD